MGDHLTVARYLLIRIAEEWGVKVSFHPKPFPSAEFNGSGCHTNISFGKSQLLDYIIFTEFIFISIFHILASTRSKETGMKAIEDMINKLAAKHSEHIAAYGEDNDLRLTGKHETGHIADFSSGIANRGCSIRIPRHVAAQGYGYIEDRRPASNIDPYRVTGLIVQTTLLD